MISLIAWLVVLIPLAVLVGVLIGQFLYKEAWVPGDYMTCPTCKGDGFYDTSKEPYDLDVPMMLVKCWTCAGSGEYYIPSSQEMQ